MVHVRDRRYYFFSAAFYCFANKGYDQTSIDDIIKISGGSKLSLYQYYGSKEKLYLYIYDIILQRYRCSMQIIESSCDGMRDSLCCLLLLALISASNGAPRAGSRRLALYNEILTFHRAMGCGHDNIFKEIDNYSDKLAIKIPINYIIIKSILCGYAACEEIFKDMFGCDIIEYVTRMNSDRINKL